MIFELRTLEEYSDDALIAEVRRVAEELNGKRLTIERFDSIARVHSTTLRYRFGSWRAALDRAGIGVDIAPRQRVLSKQEAMEAIRACAERNPAGFVTVRDVALHMKVHPTSLTRKFGKWQTLLAEVGLKPAPLGRHFSELECFENVLLLWTHYGRQPHFEELKKPPSQVGPKAYINRWGGWRSALAAFVRFANETSALENSSSLKLNEERIGQGPDPAANSHAENLDPITSRSISLSLRYKVLCRDKFSCVICGASPAKSLGVELHVDHIIPWSKGGATVEENLRTLCSACNLGKGARIEELG